MAQQRKFLFFSSSEHGQANVLLAVLHELLRHGDCEAHVASFLPLQKRLHTLQPNSDRLTFHSLPAPSMFECIERQFGGNADQFLMHSTSFSGSIEGARRCADVLCPWTADEYLKTYEFCKHLIQTIDPVTIVIDPVFAQGIDACRSLSLPYTILSPVSLAEMVPSIQPKLAFLRKYPAVGSGYPFPLPWYLILLNVVRAIWFIYAFMVSNRLKEICKFRQQVGLAGRFPSLEIKAHGAQMIVCGTLPEIDLPFTLVPGNVTCCGPILLPTQPIDKSDADLAVWLKRGPTILINLGSHVASDRTNTREIATALKAALDANAQLQVLWKLKSHKKTRDAVDDVLSVELSQERIKVVEWLAPDPPSLFETGSIIYSVHHGGANSFFEATRYGVPQIVLPVWYDTYCFATKVEYLGIGVFGSKRSAPYVNSAEFANALAVVAGPTVKSKAIRTRARELGELCQKSGEGRVAACEKIMSTAYTKI